MSTYTYPLTASLGPSYGGQASALTATLYDPSGTSLLAGITFTEVGAGSGEYEANPTFQSTWTSGRVRYTWTGTPAIPLLPPDVVAPMLTVGPVESVTAPVTLTAGEHTAMAVDTQTGLTAQGYTTARAGYLDTLNGLVAAIWAAATRTLTALANVTVAGYASGQDPATLLLVTPANKLAADGTGKVGANNLPTDYQQRAVAITLPGSPGGVYDAPAALAAQGVTSARLAHLDSDISSRLAAGSYVSPDNTDVVSALADLVTLLARTDPTSSLSALAAAITTAQASLTTLQAGVKLTLSQAIPTSVPTVGTVGEALAAARAGVLGKESKAGNVITLSASDDTSTLANLTYSPSIGSPTSRVRS